MMIKIKHIIEKIMVDLLFEPNDDNTRIKLHIYLDYYLKQIPLSDYIITCDKRNNTPEIIDNGILRIEIIHRSEVGVDIYRYQIVNVDGEFIVEEYNV